MQRTAARVLERRTRLAAVIRSASSLVSGGTSTTRSTLAAGAAQRVYKNPFLSSIHARTDDVDATAVAPEPLLALGQTYKLYPNDVHCFLGLNGSGKSRFLRELQQLAASQVHEQCDNNEAATTSNSSTSSQQPRCHIASLSLDAHREFVALHGDKVVANVLGGVGSSNARDVIVRLGLFPVWESHVRHLSTGEMRKLLLAVALLATPRANVLVLDQPFDGLDVAARAQLTWLLTQLTRGFTRLLVNTGGRNDAQAYRTQVLLVANRLEHVVPEILTHMVLMATPSSTAVTDEQQHGDAKTDSRMALVPCSTSNSRSIEQLRTQLDAFYAAERIKRPAMAPNELVARVCELFDCSESPPTAQSQPPVPALALQQVTIAYGDRVLLECVDFVRAQHEHWALLGPNGSGKSSLLRVLLQTPGHGLASGDVVVNGHSICTDHHPLGLGGRRISAVSTDQHIRLLHESIERTSQSTTDTNESVPSAFDLIAAHAASSHKAELAAALLQLDVAMLQTRPLAKLSQGEQKLVLIARALAACPDVLLLDEITHGLDPINRAHVLAVVDAIGHVATTTHVVLITHHDDEIVSCFGDRVFEICDKQLVARAARAGGQQQQQQEKMS